MSWLMLALLAVSQEWPQFRGPGGQGQSLEHGLPIEWSESKNVAWKVPVPGRGWSSPVVSGGRVWLTTATPLRQGYGGQALRLLAYDVETGKQTLDVEVFQLRSSELQNPKNSHASPTPIVDGDRVYVHFGADGTAAVSASGKILWKTQLPYQSQHGNGGSPELAGDLLIVNCDGFDESFVAALDTRTGKTRWRTDRRQPSSQAYSTPLAIHAGDRDQIVSVGAFNTVAYDPQNGKEIWRASYPEGFSNVPRPVYGAGLVFISTGFNQPSLLAIRPDGRGDVTKTHVAWKLSRGAPLTPSPLVAGDELYVVSDNGIASCLDARTGTLHWQQRLGNSFSASPVLADGRIYFLDEDGRTTVIKPGPVFTPLAANVLDGPTLASMAVAAHSFFIRTGTHLYRIMPGSLYNQPRANDSGRRTYLAQRLRSVAGADTRAATQRPAHHHRHPARGSGGSRTHARDRRGGGARNAVHLRAEHGAPDPPLARVDHDRHAAAGERRPRERRHARLAPDAGQGVS
jgi:outer membrane protein assembly factor BamB